VLLIAPPVCERCGIPLPSRLESICTRCRRQAAAGAAAPALDRCRSAGLYEGSLREIIHAFKYGARRSLARRLARFIRSHAEARALLDGIDAIVPVPLHRTRKRSRGFNQSKDLAKALKLDAPVLRTLRRVRATRPQTDLPAAQRHRNVRGAFAVAGKLEADCVLLVDDVCTTGATLEACARVLKEAGVREVRAITVARVSWPQAR
jgi:ComF family protein